MKRKYFALFIVAILLVYFFMSQCDLSTILTYLTENYIEKPLLAKTAFVFVFIGITVLGLPGAALLSIFAGMIFGFIRGISIVMFASSISAMISFWGGRYLLKDFVRKRFSQLHSVMNRGVEREGGFYVFALRLIPGIPFPVVNMSLGITSLNTLTYGVSSFLGMLPVMSLLVNAGTGIEEVSSVKTVFTPRVIISLLCAALISVVVKKVFSMLSPKS